ncbi:hypothetical protein [Bradyrhizobium nitroreducens]|uniref:hypothetical protein n=1 Tax=Bradyrhizobium nitroreducens TaxID=709803 RepID=UPI000C1E1395|nr:hypothetical protein [Bradyrhizobium nitroreducens]
MDTRYGFNSGRRRGHRIWRNRQAKAIGLVVFTGWVVTWVRQGVEHHWHGFSSWESFFLAWFIHAIGVSIFSVFAAASIVGNRLKELKQRASEGIWDSLSEWKSLIAQMGTKEDFDRYIAHKLDPVWEELNKNATEQLAYCVARISGHITDEMHAMSPDKLREFVERTKGLRK